MLDREAVREFLDETLEGIEIPKDISFDTLVETFCKYTEEDYYEWMKDSYRSFFQPLTEGGVDWGWIREKIEHCLKLDNNAEGV